MSNSIEDIKFPSDFLAAIDKVHAEASELFDGISNDAKALAKKRSKESTKISSLNTGVGNVSANNAGSKSGGLKM